MIYFIRDPAADRVKIGVSNNPWKRLRNMQTGAPSPLILEAVIRGERTDEFALHAKFRDRRVQGEWFVWRGAVAAHVASLVDQLVPVPAKERVVLSDNPLRRYRQELSITLEALAADVGVSYAQLSRIERGWLPSMTTAIRLADRTGLTLDQIVNRTTDQRRVA